MNEPGGIGSRKRGLGAVVPVPSRPGSLNTAHMTERPDIDRADGPEDDRQAELCEHWYGWGEDWNDAA